MDVVTKSRILPPDNEGPVLSFFPQWCKRCGNCVEFCPRGALASDEQKRPFLARPERCTRCGLCQLLCPDFAVCLAEEGRPPAAYLHAPPSRQAEASADRRYGPERLASAPENGRDDQA
jgi:2-oxoglutarate ferredoxin oxidoreductase subunit delta